MPLEFSVRHGHVRKHGYSEPGGGWIIWMSSKFCLEASGNRLQHECMACLLSTAMPHAMQESAADTHTTPIEDWRQPANSNGAATGCRLASRHPGGNNNADADADAGIVLTVFDNAIVLSSSFSQAANQ
ncbi:hypothetical protein E4U30_006601 [Claviceps sp. LM220 group G6]|nr:hypothetical protein E4U30_006601 [Claviceps sp. LM220 group G6]